MKNSIYDTHSKKFGPSAVTTFLAMGDKVNHETINAIQKFMQDNANDMSASQLRNIFSRLKVKNSDPSQIPMMRVKLAYLQGKTEARKRGAITLLKLLDDMMQQIKGNTSEDKMKLKGLLTFFEAILAYHKYYVKTDNHATR